MCPFVFFFKHRMIFKLWTMIFLFSQNFTYLNKGTVYQLSSIIQPYNIVIHIPSYLKDNTKIKD